MEKQIQELKEKLEPLGFFLNGSFFENKNMRIYFREDYSQWRLKDTSVASSMDIVNINFPLDEEEVNKIFHYCSKFYRG